MEPGFATDCKKLDDVFDYLEKVQNFHSKKKD